MLGTRNSDASVHMSARLHPGLAAQAFGIARSAIGGFENSVTALHIARHCMQRRTLYPIALLGNNSRTQLLSHRLAAGYKREDGAGAR